MFKNLFSKIKESKGFTLMELLIVIGVLAVLTTAATLVLNPAELLKQARDSTRISDLSTLNEALSLYVTNVSAPDLDGGTDSCSTLCYTATTGVAANCDSRHTGKTTTIDATREVDANGWVPVDFADIPGGAPLAVLPIDPTNTSTYFYSYACDNTNKTFELDTVFESTKYLTTEDYDAEDGGSSATTYELGTDPGLDI
ncbi:MAG: type II secretion system protein [Candidatus Paceibacterota bacterium]